MSPAPALHPCVRCAACWATFLLLLPAASTCDAACLRSPACVSTLRCDTWCVPMGVPTLRGGGACRTVKARYAGDCEAAPGQPAVLTVEHYCGAGDPNAAGGLTNPGLRLAAVDLDGEVLLASSHAIRLRGDLAAEIALRFVVQHMLTTSATLSAASSHFGSSFRCVLSVLNSRWDRTGGGWMRGGRQRRNGGEGIEGRRRDRGRQRAGEEQGGEGR